MKIVGIIPARMGSSRFPGKPLALIAGRPMIYHVYWRSKMSKRLSDVFIATCDKEIEEYCINNKMNVVMTKDTHERASDRTAEAMLKIEKIINTKIDIPVMIQGDEPMLVPEMIDLAVEPLVEDKNVSVVNLMSPLKSDDEHDDPNEVKVVVDKNNFALYFSREPIPSRKKGVKASSILKQVCIIPFTREFLLEFNELPQTPLEIAESVDMLRVLEHGGRVKMAYSPYETYSVDTKEDLEKVESLMKNDKLIQRYDNKA
ncbi:MAG: 3-deoxy-manno-octulosonate cytidylyltransferase [Thermodesulfovibrionia bacterium]|nr:3-deoxy-manno-octulosonate cytidylyltransferase [Thermodesulfovibrionia bacterium]